MRDCPWSILAPDAGLAGHKVSVGSRSPRLLAGLVWWELRRILPSAASFTPRGFSGYAGVTSKSIDRGPCSALREPQRAQPRASAIGNVHEVDRRTVRPAGRGAGGHWLRARRQASDRPGRRGAARLGKNGAIALATPRRRGSVMSCACFTVRLRIAAGALAGKVNWRWFESG